MAQKRLIVAGITFSRKSPTLVSFADLFNWVIWQFPRPLEDGLRGAVRPPIEGHGWYPAVIFPGDERVQVYGHVAEPFDSPEAAAESLGQAAKKAS